MKKAFTLAEVLITLGIIGVVAAMTMPALINKYQSKVFETAFKKQYSVIQNAIEYSTMVNAYQNCYVYFPKGSNAYHYEDSDCEALRNDLVESLKLTPLSKEIFKNYKTDKAAIFAAGGSSINSGCSYDRNVLRSTPYMLPDGAILMVAININGVSYPSIVIDVNGEKGPNKWGYDVFFMVLSNHNQETSKVLLTDEFCSIIEKGGRYPRTILQNKNTSDRQSTSIMWK